MFVIRDYCFYVISSKPFTVFGVGLSTICISYPHRITPTPLQTDRMAGGIT